jgi:hypothetical protein
LVTVVQVWQESVWQEGPVGAGPNPPGVAGVAAAIVGSQTNLGLHSVTVFSASLVQVTPGGGLVHGSPVPPAGPAGTAYPQEDDMLLSHEYENEQVYGAVPMFPAAQSFGQFIEHSPGDWHILSLLQVLQLITWVQSPGQLELHSPGPSQKELLLQVLQPPMPPPHSFGQAVGFSAPSQ